MELVIKLTLLSVLVSAGIFTIVCMLGLVWEQLKSNEQEK